MRNTMTRTGKRSFVVVGLLLLMSLTSIGLAEAAANTLLTGEEKYWLTYMREEEKLARDVYLTLYGQWRLTIFDTISKSEQTHMDAVETLLDRYGLADPADGRNVGEFADPDLQKLYNDLVKQGSVSEVEALKAGVIIEETDIEDLNAAIAATKRKDLKNVYSHLLQGSLNHLKAFVSNLAKYGVVYEP